MSRPNVSWHPLFRILSLCLVVGSLLLYIRPHTRGMGTPYLLEALCFLLVSAFPTLFKTRLLWSLPCLPAFVYHVVRLWNFLRMGTWHTLYFAEVLLLAVTYLAAALLLLMHGRQPLFRLIVLLLFAVCIGFGVWSIIDGWWVLWNHTWTPFSERLSLFLFYYIPDTLFWILPFLMLGKPILDKT